MKALIGHTGVVGQAIAQSTVFDTTYNSQNIDSMSGHYDLVVCAAPSGARMLVNADSVPDTQAILQIQNALGRCSIAQFVLISSIDSVNYPDTPYGRNRKDFESWAMNQWSNSVVIRLSSIIAPNIRKNILYDIKHQQWLERINPATQLQWCCLQDIVPVWQDMIVRGQRELNLVSEPIVNQDILARWAPGVHTNNSLPTQCYELQPYYYTRDQILTAMEEYMS